MPALCWQRFPLHACDYQLLLSSWRHNLSKTLLLVLERMSVFFPIERCVISKATVFLSSVFDHGKGGAQSPRAASLHVTATFCHSVVLILCIKPISWSRWSLRFPGKFKMAYVCQTELSVILLEDGLVLILEVCVPQVASSRLYKKMRFLPIIAISYLSLCASALINCGPNNSTVFWTIFKEKFSRLEDDFVWISPMWPHIDHLGRSPCS